MIPPVFCDFLAVPTCLWWVKAPVIIVIACAFGYMNAPSPKDGADE